MKKRKKILSWFLVCTIVTSYALTSLITSPIASAATSGLLLKYDFNEGGGSVANDTSGNGLNGTLQGAGTTLAAVEGKNFGGLLLNGANDSLVRIPNDLFKDTTVNDITVSVNVNLAAAANGFVASLGSGGSTSRLVGIKLAGNTITGYYNNNYNGGTNRSVNATAASLLNTWTNVTFVVSPSAGSIKLYLDGVLKGTTTGAIAPISALYDSTKTFGGYIGESYWTGDPNINGRIDDFRVYNYAMTDQQVADLAGVTAAANAEDSTASTAPGAAPQLPKYVTVKFSDGTSQQAEVTWPAIDPASYASSGQFEVTGTTTYGGLQAKVRVYVLEAPDLQLDTKDTTSITLKWPVRDGAVKYSLYRSDTQGSGYAKVYEGSALTCKDTGLEMNKTYYYYLNYTTNIATSSNSAELAVKTAAIKVDPPSQFFQGSILYPSRVELGWKSVPYADSYNIYRSDTENGDYLLIAANVLGIIYKDRAVTWGKTYFYKIASVNDAGEGLLYSVL